MKATPVTYLVTINGQTFLKAFRVVRVPRIGESVVIASFRFRVKDVEQDLDAHTDGFYSDRSCEAVHLEIELGQDETRVIAALIRTWQADPK